LQENAASKKIIAKASRLADQSPDFGRIRCPLCKWHPKPSHHWFCAPCDYPEFFADGCGTSCCERWSLHKDWYEDESNKRQ